MDNAWSREAVLIAAAVFLVTVVAALVGGKQVEQRFVVRLGKPFKKA